MLSYRRLDDAQIAETLVGVRGRIAEHFPEANLRLVCEQLIETSREVAALTAYLRRPNWSLRVLGGVLTLGLVALLIAVARVSLGTGAPISLPDLIQTLEAGVNDIVFFGIAVYFLFTIERRAKRRRALDALHELRSLAHVVDMHQLTKDPERLNTTPAKKGKGTAGVDLGRYLDFCSELLSVISMVAAQLVQDFDDSQVLAGVNEVVELTTGLSGKIWQKISILERARTR